VDQERELRDIKHRKDMIAEERIHREENYGLEVENILENNKKFQNDNEELKKAMYDVDTILKQTREELMESVTR
jgi:ABC-type phosphate transport system auxiliary subunit